MAVIDAVANSIRIPLWRLFGGASNSVTTDITIPIVTPNEAAQLAAKYRGQGFQTLKLNVGKNLNSDMEVLKAIRLVHPDCSFILDANEGYTSKQAIEVLDRLNEMGVTPVLFEQPVHRDDWEGLRDVSVAAMERYRVAVAADESCRSLLDAQKIIHGNLAHVINIKLAKMGVLGALEVIDAARKAGIALMIGGMVETRIAMGFAGHLAAGLGCFSFIDLDTPLLLSEDPVYGGYEAVATCERVSASSVSRTIIPPARAPARQPNRSPTLRAPTPPPPTPTEPSGFDALKDTFSVDVAAAEARPLDMPLAAPFTIASSRLDAVSNVAVRVELSSGAVGWGGRAQSK
ncbi:hypothetical protein QYE76_016498 [Lolium multiflorum]|uniref:Dipeptide epimerase n=1 Tax=Lolium multiflorum TaxID=4521 RepID=A0AAD8PHL7_LOLMU|nr:hypothetical protein QYE76_016498 [Lolium multiflorum]